MINNKINSSKKLKEKFFNRNLTISTIIIQEMHNMIRINTEAKKM